MSHESAMSILRQLSFVFLYFFLSGYVCVRALIGIQSIKAPHVIMGMMSACVWKPKALPLRICSLCIFDK